MFTGIIEAVGKLVALERYGVDARLRFDTGKLDMTDVRQGDSIAVSGVCLTAVALGDGSFTADVSAETLGRTTLGSIGIGAGVNLERALTPTTRLGGHFVSGHIDGIGELLSQTADGRSQRMRFRVPTELARYVAGKGSICIEGVSLTVNEVAGATFSVNVVPHTLAATTLGSMRPGQRVNVEVDMLARYLERLMLGERAAEPSGGITAAFLSEHGFKR
ncbi:MAG: riboflavin synthase [Pseudomonadota bacterium]|nr:MAG: riboflavin synthase [Pseudomonadota bacterium]